MYPFERFTRAAKATLTLAQAEAERRHHSYIGTEHIVLALASQQGTVAGEALVRLGVAYEQLRDGIDRVLGLNERIIIQQIIPTSRVKNVIEMAFAEAQRTGSTHVGTDHLLLALLIEGEGIAAHVLVDSGATLEAVRAAVEQVRDSGISEPRSSVEPRVDTRRGVEARLSSTRPGAALPGADAEAARDLDEAVGDVHLLRVLLTRGDKKVLAALRRVGVDPADLRAALMPPDSVVELRRALRDTVSAKRGAVAREDYLAADRARNEELELRLRLAKEERAWEESSATDS